MARGIWGDGAQGKERPGVQSGRGLEGVAGAGDAEALEKDGTSGWWADGLDFQIWVAEDSRDTEEIVGETNGYSATDRVEGDRIRGVIGAVAEIDDDFAAEAVRFIERTV